MKHRRWLLPLAALLLLALGTDIWRRSTFISPHPTAIVTDRDGMFMAQIGGGLAGYGYWPVPDVPPRVAAAILALEDRRFWDHPGVDPLAVLRALRLDLASGRRVSGASTLAMQVARMQHPEARTLPAKFIEAAAALVMTARYGRMGVLRQYLLLVPLGQNSHGIAHAAAWYFGRPVQDLSWAQIAFLAAIPQAPGADNPARLAGLARIKTRAAEALARLYAQHVFDQPTYQEALADLQALRPLAYPRRAPDALHAILQIASLARRGQAPELIHGTINLALQTQATAIADARLASFAPLGAQQVAVLVVDRPSMDVLALVGSAQYGPENDGEIDYALRWRSPGSTLKPLIYAEALQTGGISAASVLQDAPDSYTGVADADRRFLGPMLAAQALANSRNVPAADLVRTTGLAQSQLFLASAGIDDQVAPSPRYGLSLAIGALPTELTRLVAAYGALANGGLWQPLRWYQAQTLPPARQIFSLAAARGITLFLADPMARLPSFARMGATEFPFPVAVKTGTSQGYRDAWVVEYSARYIVGVWVGRPDGQPMDGIGGANGAALIGQDLLHALSPMAMDGQDDGSFPPPPGTRPVQICASTGAPAGTAGCADDMVEYLPGGAVPLPAAAPQTALHIVSPPDGESYFLSPDAAPGATMLPLRANTAGNAGFLDWFIDGQEYQAGGPAETVLWHATQGRHEIRVRDGFGHWSIPVHIRVQ
jgi:penicillin-binding protein 1C